MIADGALARIDWQPVVFANRPRRADLARLRPSWSLQPLTIRIHRNHTVEFAVGPLRTFLAYAGWEAAVEVTDYDDALTATITSPATLELIWLDLERYRAKLEPGELSSWLAGRIDVLRARTDAPILVADAPGEDPWARDVRQAMAAALSAKPGIAIVPVSAVAQGLGDGFQDTRAGAITASTLSDAASIAIARLLAFEAIPPRLQPRLKAIALDLDNTLIGGVLGEDGPQGIAITDDHQALYRVLRTFADAGVLLALISKNEPADVETLFRSRPDLALPWQGFSATAIGWGRKSAGPTAIAERLNIGIDALLFVDDNPGELAEVAAAHPAVRSLLATSPADVARALACFPGLTGYRGNAADAVRAQDLAAAEARSTALADLPDDPAAYARELGARLDLRLDPQDLVDRLAELSGKTNQFNTALLRLTDLDVARRLRDPDCRTVSVALSDRLSDAGVVGAVCCHREGNLLVVEEIALSCRALGRGVETIALLSAIERAAASLACDRVRIPFTAGPRNGPARTWLDTLPAGIDDAGVAIAAIRDCIAADPHGLVPHWEES